MSDYRLDQHAVDDLRAIWRFLAIERMSQQAAKRQIQRLEAAFSLLAKQPFLGEARNDLSKGVRAFVCSPYVILYRAEMDLVSIGQIVHASRDMLLAFRQAGDLSRPWDEASLERDVEEFDLDFRFFHCCGDEDLYPFGCPECGRLMVFCYECDTLYDDLRDLTAQEARINHSTVSEPIFDCPHCSYSFEYFFVRDGRYKVKRRVWLLAGLGNLLLFARTGQGSE